MSVPWEKVGGERKGEKKRKKEVGTSEFPSSIHHPSMGGGKKKGRVSGVRLQRGREEGRKKYVERDFIITLIILNNTNHRRIDNNKKALAGDLESRKNCGRGEKGESRKGKNKSAY